jgi:nucleoside-diphosphate-sugar epimerase
MGYHKFIRAILDDQPVPLTGDGHQVRGNTYVSDCVEATIRALEAIPGEVYNLGGGQMVSVWDVLRTIESITKKKAIVQRFPERPGDQRYTGADIGRITRHLGWKPATTIEEGLAKQIEWQARKSSRIAA